MEIAALVIAILAFISVSALWFSAADKVEIQMLQEIIKELKKANKIIYKDLVEEYRLLIKSYSEVKYHLDGVEFNPYLATPLNEFILYTDLESKIAEVQALKARLCDNQCVTKAYVDKNRLETSDGSEFINIDLSPLDKIDEKTLEKYLGKDQVKKLRKPRKKK